MPLEPSVTNIADLNPAWPSPADPKADGDDHIRNNKKVLLNDFAGYTGAVLVTGTDGGAVNAYTVTPTTALPLQAYGLRTGIAFSPSVANTAACTLNVSALGAKPLRAVDGSDLAPGDLIAGSVYDAVYTGSEFRLRAPTKNYVDQKSFATSLPGQSGNAGKFITTDGTSSSWGLPQNMPRSTRTANVTLAQSDRATLVDITAGTFTQTFSAATTLTNGWYCWLRNLGTGDITLDPNASETIDGLTSFVMYPGEMRLIQCDGAGFTSVVVHPFNKTFTATGTFVKPPGYTDFGGLAWSGGSSGGRSGSLTALALSGHGGGCFPFTLPAAKVGATETITIGAGGASFTGTSSRGTGGGDTLFGAIFTVFGARSGRGGAIGISAGFWSDQPRGFEAANSGASSIDYSTTWGGATCDFNGQVPGSSIYGGAAGGSVSASAVAYAPGASAFGGNGGVAFSTSSGADGVAPGGGGGATQTGAQSGAGARGELRVWGIV